MPLYHVEDHDRPLYVVATGFEDAIYKWKLVISKENNILPSEIDNGPQGVHLICDDDELVINETTQRALG